MEWSPEEATEMLQKLEHMCSRERVRELRLREPGEKKALGRIWTPSSA